ncbi:tRNA uridine(34) 5-carboxymethylaminomethyl modification radical SAM/GNAT enzyme Elp3 [Thermogymnomonas acidicola]|uniref:tRNA carboxymethyluridine synthase n=1 Tax=Thermogymnomonas acidicola TaxID=399579 RepID=A0AA37FAG3_9ARCH|nr:tRNA uridine(34) 5-carboxymethylaminomethyl modification radical SAM/GNAT enzyme Elp3 [Thermogymnomonas acidicola]GGM79120.1 tRNA uridine(34) 5-carboxymethylaminomethyl modification radical SAM/GNAT enzyme Elp3 [Thermogymnomonas acidicola]
MLGGGEADFFQEILAMIRSGSIRDKEALHRAKVQLARKYGLGYIPGDVEILHSSDLGEGERELLRIKRTRTISGVSVVAVMTSPERCPHGRCIYCPGGVENNSPQAYTGYEPAALRGRTYAYDPYEQTFNRLRQLETIGHDTSKVDLIVMGGTFTARPEAYQREFVRGCLDAMNRQPSSGLEESMLVNEDSDRRCIGLTVETKPDWFFEREIDLSLSYGTTKVELGVQIINERVLRLNGRGHGVGEIVRATQLARDAGLKIVYHVMPGMYGATEEDDMESFRLMMEDPRFMPDMLKIYPTLVVRGTPLYGLWRSGRYTPPDTERAVRFLQFVLTNIKPWVRIQRIQRDIPVKFISAGVKRSDIRNLAERMLAENGMSTMEIRSREVGKRGTDLEDCRLVRRDYMAAGGREVFLSYETGSGDIVGFLRLRLPSDMAHRKEVIGSSIVREIKVFGEVVPVGSRPEAEWQHRGFGKALMAEAERVSREEFGVGRILVISGIGVRNYFRNMGYERLGPYMAKSL